MEQLTDTAVAAVPLFVICITPEYSASETSDALTSIATASITKATSAIKAIITFFFNILTFQKQPD